jgi:hypothetical protein
LRILARGLQYFSQKIGRFFIKSNICLQNRKPYLESKAKMFYTVFGKGFCLYQEMKESSEAKGENKS